MYAGAPYAGAPFGGAFESVGTGELQTIPLPSMSIAALVHPPDVEQYYPIFDPEDPIFDPEDPAYNPPAWWTPTAEPGQSMAPRGIQVDHVTLPSAPDTDGIVTPILDAYDRQWQDSLDADGSGGISMDENIATPGESVLRFRLNNKPAFQVIVNEIVHNEVHQDEEYGQNFSLDGPGAVALLGNAAVMADFGLNNRPLGDTRYFNFSAKTLPTLGWKPAVRTLPRYNTDNFYGRPKGMLGALINPGGAEWLWDRLSEQPVPGGDVYFRQWFTYSGTKAIVARVEGAADDEMQLWIDNVPILNIEGVYAGGMSWTTFELSPGTHLVAWRGRNRNALRAGTIWAIGTMTSTGFFDSIIARSNSTDAICLGYPKTPPGFTVGQAARQLIIEAQAREEIPYISTSFLSDHDSHSNPWPKTSELSCSLDQSLLSAFRSWTETHWEIAMASASFKFHAWVKGLRGNQNSPVAWQTGVDLTEFNRTRTPAPTVAIVKFDGGRTEVVHPDAAIIGRRIINLSFGHIRSLAQAKAEGMAHLEAAKRRTESIALGVDPLVDTNQAYGGLWVGDSPTIITPTASERMRIHSFSVSEDEDEAVVVPEVVSSQITTEERLFVGSLVQHAGSGGGKSKSVRPAQNIPFPSNRAGEERPLGFSWQDLTGAVQLIYLGVDGVTPTVLATLDPPPGGRAKVTLNPTRIGELTQIVLAVGGSLSQEKRTDTGIWLMEFSVDRDPDPARGTADVSIITV